MNELKVLCFLLIGSLCFTGCSGATNGESKSAERKLKIVTTTGMVTDIVLEIVGDKAEVIGLMGSTVDPHLYQPFREDGVQLNGADVIFYSGLKLEGRMGDLFEQVRQQGKPIFPVTDGISKNRLREPPEFEGHPDPHVWMDVSLWKQATEFITKKMIEVDPEHAAEYQQNWETYSAKLDELDQYAKQSIASIPAEQRVLITAHDAFGYFGEAYGLQVLGVQGISTESAAGVDDINKLVKFIVDHKIQALFVETTVSENNIQALIEGAANKGWQIRIGGNLYSDAMGEEGTYEGTYEGMIDHNVTVIVRSLGGQAPEAGLHGKLKLESDSIF
ncbi:MAG: zinc ABC transporter substrate-binding protein [Planctomycetaceae bacterium]|nr:zinc ABC transporter substrate-binding protein [Planctomycetaceae bacterium]